MVQAEQSLIENNKLGEGSLCHPGKERLYWVDFEGEIFTADK
jgi:hypothetical protein